MPRLQIVRLPNDHTQGTIVGQADADRDGGRQRPGAGAGGRGSQPRASSGRRRRSSSWKTTRRTARTTSTPTARWRWSISPYTKRKHVDSSMYSTASMLRTMELILGLKPMTQFDAAALPMYELVPGQARRDAVPASPGEREPHRAERQRTPGARSSPRRWISARKTRPTTCCSTKWCGGASAAPTRRMPPPVRASFVFAEAEEEEEEEEEEED